MEFDPKNNDDFCLSFINQETSEDLLDWLSKDDEVERSLGETFTKDQAEQLAAELQIAGAIKIWAVDIERATDDCLFENSGKICVLLPNIKAKREDIIDIGNDIANELGFDSIPDMGQKYLYISLD